MTAVLEQLPVTAPRCDSEHIVLQEISWDFYQALLRELNERRLFVTYDDGVMELMSPSLTHDRGSRELAFLIALVAEQFDIPMSSIGSTTMQREDLKKGIEADEAFYFANHAALIGIKDLDLSKLPPPDLAVEVEISNRLGMRKGIYAALGVAEIWRYDGKTLTVELLQPDGSYITSTHSPTLPMLPIEKVPRLIQQGLLTDTTSWMRLARQWIRDNCVPG